MLVDLAVRPLALLPALRRTLGDLGGFVGGRVSRGGRQGPDEAGLLLVGGAAARVQFAAPLIVLQPGSSMWLAYARLALSYLMEHPRRHHHSILGASLQLVGGGVACRVDIALPAALIDYPIYEFC